MAWLRLSSNSHSSFSSTYIHFWRIAQITVWTIGLVILIALFLTPELGLDLFWNILIPIAPLLFVLALGIWRNVCPMATSTLLPRHLGWSQKLKPNHSQIGLFNLLGVIALYTIVPLRHSIFNTNGVATGILIISLLLIGVVLGFFFDWKSAWCSGLCPIYPVEKMYGNNVITTPFNAHCDRCVKCVNPCPDSSQNFHPFIYPRWNRLNISSLLTIGGLPGFIIGWFQVADRYTAPNLQGFLYDIALPTTGLAGSILLYVLFRSLLHEQHEKLLNRFFAATAISCYYWFRLPALLGFGDMGEDGLLIDLSNTISPWMIYSITIGLVIFFFYWIVFHRQNKKSWTVRPAFV